MKTGNTPGWHLLGSSRSSTSRHSGHHEKQLTFEQLEPRVLLAARPIRLRPPAADALVAAVRRDSVAEINWGSTVPATSQGLHLMPISADTASKPQSKVWFHDNTWWSVLPNPRGTWLWRLDGMAWVPVLQLSPKTTIHADTKVVGDITHILLYNGVSTELASVEYVAGSPGTYRFWSARPGLTGLTLSNGVETATIDVDSTARMWVASDTTNSIEVRYSDFPYAGWSEPITIASDVSGDDIASVKALPNGMIGVLWSNQVAKRFGFRVHVDGTDPNDWSADEVPAGQSPQPVGHGIADDHLNVAVASDGTLYAAVKTSYDKKNYPKIGLLVRHPTGGWDPLYAVDNSGTRPIVVINEAADSLMVAYTQKNGSNNIVCRVASRSAIAFGPAQTLIAGRFNNVSSARDGFTDQLVVIASSGKKVTGAFLSTGSAGAQ